MNPSVYMKNCDYARSIMGYLVLGNHWEGRAIRLNELQKKVRMIRGHANRSMLYRTLKQLETLKVIKVVRFTKRGRIYSGKSSNTEICLIVDSFRETLSEWCVSLGYEGFRDFLNKNGYPYSLNVIKSCRLLKDGYTYIHARRKNTNLMSFAR